LDELKKEHQNRHHPTTVKKKKKILYNSYWYFTIRYLLNLIIRFFFLQVATKGYAQFNMFCSMKEESMMFESQSSVIASLTWNNVEKVLECPPLSSKATLVSTYDAFICP